MEKVYKLIGKKGRTTVPFEIRMKMRIGYNSLVSYEMKDENTVILRKEKISIRAIATRITTESNSTATDEPLETAVSIQPYISAYFTEM